MAKPRRTLYRVIRMVDNKVFYADPKNPGAITAIVEELGGVTFVQRAITIGHVYKRGNQLIHEYLPGFGCEPIIDCRTAPGT